MCCYCTFCWCCYLSLTLFYTHISLLIMMKRFFKFFFLGTNESKTTTITNFSKVQMGIPDNRKVQMRILTTSCKLGRIKLISTNFKFQTLGQTFHFLQKCSRFSFRLSFNFSVVHQLLNPFILIRP